MESDSSIYFLLVFWLGFSAAYSNSGLIVYLLREFLFPGGDRLNGRPAPSKSKTGLLIATFLAAKCGDLRTPLYDLGDPCLSDSGEIRG